MQSGWSGTRLAPYCQEGGTTATNRNVPEPYREQVFAFIYDGGIMDATHMRVFE